MLCWASAAWSIEPARSLDGALQVTAILAGALVFLAGPPAGRHDCRAAVRRTPDGNAARRRDRRRRRSCWATHSSRSSRDAPLSRRRHEIQSRHRLPGASDGRNWPSSRIAGAGGTPCLWTVSVAVILAIGASLAGQVAALAGILVLALAFWLPRAAATDIRGRDGPARRRPSVRAALGWPEHRTDAGTVPEIVGTSPAGDLGLHDRARASNARCSAGASRAPGGADQPGRDGPLCGAARPGRYYPHNQWLELWIETGALGAAMGLAFALLVVRRIRRLPRPMRPFAYAAFASAVTVSCVNFEVTTDSWWAALAASGYLLASARLSRRAALTRHAAVSADTAQPSWVSPAWRWPPDVSRAGCRDDRAAHPAGDPACRRLGSGMSGR